MSNQLILDVLRGAISERPPFWLMRQAGRYLPEYRKLRADAGSFMDLCLAPKLAAEVTLQPIRRFHPDGAILFSDILIIPYGLGQSVRFEEGIGPVLESIENSDDLSRLSLDGSWSRIEATYETVSRVRQELPDDVALIGFAGAPWTVATYMVEGRSSKDYAKTKQWAFSDPKGFGALIDMLVEATIRHLKSQIEAGASIVKLFDSWAGVLAPDQFEAWTIQPIRRITDRLKQDHPEIPIIGFPKGAGVQYRAFVERSGVDAVALDTSVPTEWAAREIQPLMPVQGNLDPIALVAGGDVMRSAVARIRADLSGGPFVFNLGHGVIPITPPEHVEELARLLREPNQD
jgi:uroporphyrinogen decarboxylase